MLKIEDLESKMASVEFFRVGVKTTICLITMKSGFELVASSAPVNVQDFSSERGEDIAYKRALDKLYELVAFGLHEA